MMKFIILIFLFFYSTAYCQLKLSDLTKIKVGTELFQSRKFLDTLFKAKGELQKLDRASSVYKYVFENKDFNYCDSANYEFLFVNDILSDLSIQIEYNYSESSPYEAGKFFQAVKTLFSTLTSNSTSFILQQKYSTINLKKVNHIMDKADSIVLKFNPSNSTPSFVYDEQNVYFFPNDNSTFLKFNINIFPRTANTMSTLKQLHSLIEIHLTTESLQNSYTDFYGGNWKIIDNHKTIDLTYENGVYKLPVTLAGIMTLNFTLDLGASDLSISPDVFLVLYKAGVINNNDFIGTNTYEFADGSTAKSNVFNLKTMKVGDYELHDVRVSISNNINSPLLLGQSALQKLPSYKVDNLNNQLIIE